MTLAGCIIAEPSRGTIHDAAVEGEVPVWWELAQNPRVVWLTTATPRSCSGLKSTPSDAPRWANA